MSPIARTRLVIRKSMFISVLRKDDVIRLYILLKIRKKLVGIIHELSLSLSLKTQT